MRKHFFPVKGFNVFYDPFPHGRPFRGILGRGQEFQLNAQVFRHAGGHQRPYLADIANDRNAVFVPGKGGHFHPERNLGSLGLGKALVDGFLHGLVQFYRLTQVFIQIKANQALLPQVIGLRVVSSIRRVGAL